MDILRWFRRRRSRAAPTDNRPIDPLPWEDQVAQVRSLVDALDAAARRKAEGQPASEQAPASDSRPSDPEA